MLIFFVFKLILLYVRARIAEGGQGLLSPGLRHPLHKLRQQIKKALAERLPEAKVAVNIMQEKISLTVFKDHAIIEAQDILRDIGFPVIGEPVALSGGEENQRSIAFLVRNN